MKARQGFGGHDRPGAVHGFSIFGEQLDAVDLLDVLEDGFKIAAERGQIELAMLRDFEGLIVDFSDGHDLRQFDAFGDAVGEGEGDREVGSREAFGVFDVVELIEAQADLAMRPIDKMGVMRGSEDDLRRAGQLHVVALDEKVASDDNVVV